MIGWNYSESPSSQFFAPSSAWVIDVHARRSVHEPAAIHASFLERQLATNISTILPGLPCAVRLQHGYLGHECYWSFVAFLDVARHTWQVHVARRAT